MRKRKEGGIVRIYLHACLPPPPPPLITEGKGKGEEGCFITEFPQRLSFHIAVMEPSYTVLPRGGGARASNIFIPEERGGREYAIRVRVLRGE